jgi:hypothetical protein
VRKTMTYPKLRAITLASSLTALLAGCAGPRLCTPRGAQAADPDTRLRGDIAACEHRWRHRQPVVAGFGNAEPGLHGARGLEQSPPSRRPRPLCAPHTRTWWLSAATALDSTGLQPHTSEHRAICLAAPEQWRIALHLSHGPAQRFYAPDLFGGNRRQVEACRLPKKTSDCSCRQPD